MSSNLLLSIACGVLAVVSSSLVLYNVLSAGSRNQSQRTNAWQHVRRENADAQPPPNPEPPLGLLPPPPYIPPAPVYNIITPPMTMPPYYPPPVMPGPPPNRPPGQVAVVRPAIERLNDLQILVRQRQNMFAEEDWEEFRPTEPIGDNVAFIMFSRTHRAPFVPQT